MPFRIGPLEIIIVLVIILVIFGVGRLPDAGAGLGKGIRGFKRAISGEDDGTDHEPVTKHEASRSGSGKG